MMSRIVVLRRWSCHFLKNYLMVAVFCFSTKNGRNRFKTRGVLSYVNSIIFFNSATIIFKYILHEQNIEKHVLGEYGCKTEAYKFEGICDLGSLEECINLISLKLSTNRISSVMLLRSLSSLEVLDLSSNRLTALSGLEGLKSLRLLNVAGNFLNSIDALLPLTKTKMLEALELKDEDRGLTNPIYHSTNKDDDSEVDCQIARMLNNLRVLNGVSLVDSGKEFNSIYKELNSNKADKTTVIQLPGDWTPSNVEELSFIRVGFEKNDVYQQTLDIAVKCESLEKTCYSLLKEMKESSREA